MSTGIVDGLARELTDILGLWHAHGRLKRKNEQMSGVRQHGMQVHLQTTQKIKLRRRRSLKTIKSTFWMKKGKMVTETILQMMTIFFAMETVTKRVPLVLINSLHKDEKHNFIAESHYLIQNLGLF